MTKNQGVGVVGVYVDDQDEALRFYVDKLGFCVHTDVGNGPYRWLTVQHPDQPSFQLGLFAPGPPVLDAAVFLDEATSAALLARLVLLLRLALLLGLALLFGRARLLRLLRSRRGITRALLLGRRVFL